MTSANEGGELVAFPNRAAIKAEAGAWLARLDQAPLSAEELSQFQAWVKRSNEHRECLLRMARTFDSMSVLQVLADLFPLAQVSAEKAQGGASMLRGLAAVLRPSRIFAMVIIAGIVLAIAATRFTIMPAPHKQEFATAVGEQARHVLEDGSVVMLNTDSRLSVTYTDSARAVYLVKGEASFDVAKDHRRHFVVHAGSGLAEALGTSF